MMGTATLAWLGGGGAGPTLEFHPALAWWLLVPLIMLALGLVMYLYGEQRKIAALWQVLVLTGLRMVLVGLMAILLLEPALKWTQTRSTAGTLWFVVDSSPSMQMRDPQATAVERMRWAESLGYLGASVRPGKPDVLSANLAALAGEFLGLQPIVSGAPAAPEVEARAVQQFADRTSQWAESAAALRKRCASDAVVSRDGRGITGELQRCEEAASSGATAARRAGTLREAAGAVDWKQIQTNLTLAGRELAALADAADARFVASHAGDAQLSAALSRVTRVSRAELAHLALTATEKRDDTQLRDLIPRYRVRIASFADTAQAAGTVDAGSFGEVLKQALASNGRATSISSGLQLVSEQIGPDEPASVILVTDGRHNMAGDPTEPARLLASRGVKVYGLLVGSAEVSPDAAVEQVDAPEWIFRDDTLTARTLIRMDGLSGKQVEVQFLRAGSVLDRKLVTATSNQHLEPLTFTDKPPEAPSFEYEIRVSEAPGEVNLQNNRQSFRVAVKKDKLYALVIEDRPRWEYRYLVNYLLRDQRMKVQTVLLSPAEIQGVSPPEPVQASPANTRVEAQILPQTRAEWSAFDFIVLGDVGPDVLSAQQQQFIAAAVRDKGATLVTIAGQHHMPAQYADTPLAEVLPITFTPQYAPELIVRHARLGVRPALAPEGAASVLGQFGLEAGANASLWSAVPLWYWHSPYTQVKPAASALWSIVETDAGPAPGAEAAGTLASSRRRALLSSMTIGLGKSLHLASDQSWRLRQVDGQNLHDRFWGQVVRWAVGSDLPAGGKFVRFGASRPRYTQGEPVVITARILREDLTPYAGLTFSASARALPQKDSAGKPIGDSHTVAEARMIETPEAPGYYRGTLGGLPPGDLEITLRGSEVERLLDEDPSVTQKSVLIQVLPQLDLEQRNMNTDRAMLARITQAGGGFMVDAPYADVLASHLPEVQQKQIIAQQIGFFTDPRDHGTYWAHGLFFLLFALLITAEWVVRKASGLV